MPEKLIYCVICTNKHYDVRDLVLVELFSYFKLLRYNGLKKVEQIA